MSERAPAALLDAARRAARGDGVWDQPPRRPGHHRDLRPWCAETFGIAQAERYHADPIDMFALLATNPGMARERAEYRAPVRAHPHGSHAVVYVADGAGILILRVLHQRQDPDRHLA